MWRILRNSVSSALADRGHLVSDIDIIFITRFLMEQVEQRGLRLVPWKPTRRMQAAIHDALKNGKRMSVKWVDARTKQRWRYAAALDAAPQWRIGYEREVEGARHFTNQLRRP
tara:strand:+ start:8518 stop:8856 length:339 start_codon:yes stop_codon:yes gene_type:complete